MRRHDKRTREQRKADESALIAAACLGATILLIVISILATSAQAVEASPEESSEVAEEYDPAWDIPATGTLATEGRTIAVDPKVIPYGTRVLLIWPDSTQRTYIAEDCGSGVNGNHIDVFFDDHQAARVFGVQSAMVYLETEG